MSSSLFKVFRLLDSQQIYFTLERTRSDTVRVNAVLVKERLEIDLFEDDHVEISRFRGNEDVEGEFPILEAILRDHSSPSD